MLTIALLAAPALQLPARGSAIGASPSSAMVPVPQLSRRGVLETGTAALLATYTAPAFAEETFNRMSGVLEPFTDVQKGYKLYKPVAWNQVRTIQRHRILPPRPPVPPNYLSLPLTPHPHNTYLPSPHSSTRTPAFTISSGKTSSNPLKLSR